MQVVFIGPPGAGKGTQCQLLAEYMRADHVSTGQLLRNEIDADTDQGRQARQLLSQGQLAPDNLVLAMIQHKLRTMNADRGLLFDGFPRNVHQADRLGDLLRDFARPLHVALELVVPEDEIVQRLAKRERDDDDELTVRTRLQVYAQLTAPVLDYYKDRQLLRQIDGVGETNAVFARIRECVDACQKRAG